MQTLSREEYYLALCFYLISSQAQEEVRKHEKLMSGIIKDKLLNDALNDAIYNPANRGTKKEFDDFLLNSNVTIEWKPPQNKVFKGDEEKETEIDERR